jgi:hypothetical protein
MAGRSGECFGSWAPVFDEAAVLNACKVLIIIEKMTAGAF